MSPTSPAQNTAAKPQYGIDAPGFIYGFFFAAAFLETAGWFVPAFTLGGYRIALVGPLLAVAGIVPLVLGTAMVAYGLVGKHRFRDHLLKQIAWRGDERVLDVGTGRGLLMIGAAKRLTTGKAVGIDIWRAEDLSGNLAENTRRNAALEGVSDRVELISADVRRMEFPDRSFDVVMSLLCLHNIEDANERAAACREIARVLKPGGTVLLADYVPTHGYAEILRESGLKVRGSKSHFLVALGLMWMVTATKPTIS